MAKPDVSPPAGHPRRDTILLAIYLLGSALLSVVLFPRAIHEDLRLLGPQTLQTTGRVISVTGSRHVRLSSIPGAILRGPPRPVPAQRHPPAQRPGSPVRLHRYDFEFRAAGGPPVHGFSFSGGGRYAPGDRATVTYLEKNPELNRVAGTTRDPEPGAALVLIFPLIGLFAGRRIWARHRRGRRSLSGR